jgi:predicted component of type VI protein secretion system
MDTYDYAARLKASGFSEEQAAGQTKALAEILEKQMASKLEMDERDNRLRQDIAQARQDIEKAELKLEAKIDAKIAEVNAKIAEVHARIAEAKTDTIKWMIGLLVAQTGLIIGVMMKLMHP